MNRKSVILSSSFALLALGTSCWDPRATSLPGCDSNAECGAGQICLERACIDLCERDRDCETGFICVETSCEEGERTGAPEITSIDSNGSVDGRIDHSAHRLATELRISGENLEGATILVTPDQQRELSLSIDTSNDTLVVAELPGDFAEGIYRISAVNSVGADQENVLVMQGEPGLTSLLRLDPAGGSCPGSGVGVSVGLDADSDGTLDDTEISTTQVLCDGQDGDDGQNGTNGLDGSPGPPGADGSDADLTGSQIVTRINGSAATIDVGRVEDEMPSGTVIGWTETTGCFGPDTCPCGFSEVQELRGRFPVGLDLGAASLVIPDSISATRTGGFEAHLHSGTTGTPSASQTRQGGSNANVPANTHTHDYTTNLVDHVPPFATMIFCERD